jgi:uncharacterized ferritin-like protein (DUF455 family)
MELRQYSLDALQATDWQGKTQILSQIKQDTPLDRDARLVVNEPIPGRPQLSLVSPAKLPVRSVHTPEGRAVLLHSLAHIEFNAINLALDVIWRYPDMPAQFYRDWLQVAREEALHFQLLSQHLATLGYAYGDFVAHDGLWEMAERTQTDLLARLALVPRTLEARGLDASPQVKHKLASGGDKQGAAILDIILRDEIGHVAIGNKWYRYVCAQRACDPLTTYAQLAQLYRAPKLKGPFNLQARRAAGFEEAELAALGL